MAELINISYENFCKKIDVKKEDVIIQRAIHHDPGYDHSITRIDHHLIISAVSISPLFNIKSFFEIGTCAGNTCRILSLMFPQAQIKTLDLPTNADNNHAMQLLSPLKNVKMEYYNSIFLWKKEYQAYDCVFVDGDHSFPVVASDILWSCFNSNQIVIFDNINCNGVSKTLKYIASEIKENIYIINNDDQNLTDHGIILK